MKIRQIICFASCCFILTQQSKAQTIDFSTTTTAGWTVTAGGAINATPYPFGSELSISSTGTGVGSFVSGGSWNAFDGFWTAQFAFFLPADASNVILNFSGMYADDRAVLTLNGIAIGSAGIPYQGNATSGNMVLTDGGSLVPYVFDGASGTVSGAVGSGFILGGTNILMGIVNNTGSGVYGPLQPILAGSSNDGTHFGLLGSISYTTVPEPTTVAMFGVGILSLIGLRKISL
ncbi:MAG TPA: PEP-CTERM sorting domain-containing protein [Verrucomicrobiae bacterium]|jgi:hypothetical protein